MCTEQQKPLCLHPPVTIRPLKRKWVDISFLHVRRRKRLFPPRRQQNLADRHARSTSGPSYQKTSLFSAKIVDVIGMWAPLKYRVQPRSPFRSSSALPIWAQARGSGGENVLRVRCSAAVPAPSPYGLAPWGQAVFLGSDWLAGFERELPSPLLCLARARSGLWGKDGEGWGGGPSRGGNVQEMPHLRVHYRAS